VLIGDALVNENERLQVRINQLHDKIEAALKLALRVAATQEQLPADADFGGLANVLLCYIIGGCIMDALAFLLVSLPIFYPLVMQLGYDPIWFGQVITIVTTMGSIMPPIGICCYVVSGMSGIPLGTVFRSGLYYIPSYVFSIGVLMVSPYWTVLVLSDMVK